MFKKLSVCVVGKRGSGKDTLFSAVYYKKKINSNLKYNCKTNVIKIRDILLPKDINRRSIEDMTFDKVDFEKYSFLDYPTVISDAQINFPSFEDSQLKKEYPQFAISYQVWRHLYDSGLHFNTQVFSRLWIIIREQLEDCIKCLYSIRLPFFTFMKVRYYESWKDCENNLKPLKIGFLQLIGKEEIKIENSKRGEIKEYKLLIPNRKITHNSRFYKDLIFQKGEINNESLDTNV